MNTKSTNQFCRVLFVGTVPYSPKLASFLQEKIREVGDIQTIVTVPHGFGIAALQAAKTLEIPSITLLYHSLHRMTSYQLNIKYLRWKQEEKYPHDAADEKIFFKREYAKCTRGMGVWKWEAPVQYHYINGKGRNYRYEWELYRDSIQSG